jgi:hypothetical protein
MASTAASISRNELADGEVPLWRLHVLRATYLLLVVGLGATIVPELFKHEPTARGVIPGMLSGIWLLAFLGLKYPLQMLPLLMFEFAWKGVWMLKYGLPQYYSGEMPPTWAGDFQAIAAGFILMPMVIPWGHVYRRYIKGSMDSVEDGATRIRLRVMRVAYVLLFLAGIFVIGRIFLNPMPMERGVFASMLIALFLLNVLIIRNPLKMLPVLLLECVWKLVWLAAFGLPQLISGVGSPRLGEDIYAVGLGPVLFALLIPWGYVWRHYVKQPAERWR